MKLLVAAVGRGRSGPERDLFDDYRRRLTWPLTLREVEERRPLAPDQRISREGDLLAAQIPEGAVTVVLDQRGKSLDSEGLAAALGGWRDGGRGWVVFLIGGADGHDERMRGRADLLLSLGPMTWPHMLVRALLAEQIYRSECILSNHPYHRRLVRHAD